MSINLRKGTWNCFGCGKGGGLQTLARFLGGSLDQTDLVIQSVQTEPEPEPVDFRELYESFAPIKVTTPEAQHYQREKGVSFEALQEFSTRHDRRGNLVFPYFDGDRVCAIRYRGKRAKWYETGSERTIYNINSVRGALAVVLSEGESDTHAIWETVRGSLVAVGGIPGANSSVERWELWSLDLMWAERIWIAFDNDEAGAKGAERAISVLGDRATYLPPPENYNDWSDAIKAGQTPKLV